MARLVSLLRLEVMLRVVESLPTSKQNLYVFFVLGESVPRVVCFSLCKIHDEKVIVAAVLASWSGNIFPRVLCSALPRDATGGRLAAFLILSVSTISD